MSPVVTIASIIPLSVLTALFPDEPRLAGFIGAKDNGNGGDNWSYRSSSQIVTTNKPTPNFLQAGCPSCRPTNGVEALKKNLHHSFSIPHFRLTLPPPQIDYSRPAFQGHSKSSELTRIDQ